MNFESAVLVELISLSCRNFWFIISAPFLWLTSTPRFLTVWLCLLLSISFAWHGGSNGFIDDVSFQPYWSRYLIESIWGLIYGLILRVIFDSLRAYSDIVASIMGLNNVVFRTTESSDQNAFLSSMLGIVSVIVIFQSGIFIQSIIFLDAYSPRSVEAISGMFDSSFIVKFLSWALSLALQVALPVILLSLVVNITAGYLNRIMPQASFYFLTSPAVMLFGLVLIAHSNEFLIRSLIGHVLGVIR